MRVLIIGCGYLGTALGERLAADGHEVIGLCRHVDEVRRATASGIRLVAGDLTEADGLTALPMGCDWVVLCAASRGGKAAAYRRLYIEGARRVLERLADVPPRKLVYTGSTGVYGQRDGSTVDEESPTEPAAPTARVLVEAESLLRRAAAEQGMPAVILRLAGIYGPGRGYWLKQFLAGKARTEEDGGRFLNMIHRDDAVSVVIAALEHGRPGAVYNVVDDEPVTQRELFTWLAARLNRPLPPSAGATSAAGGKGRGGSKQVSNRRLHEELGVTFRYPTFREGFAAELDRQPS